MSLLFRRYSVDIARRLPWQRLQRVGFTTVARLCREHELGSVQYGNFETKYAHKLQRRAEEQGITVDELMKQMKEKEHKEREIRREKQARGSSSDRAYASAGPPSADQSASEPLKAPAIVRKDSSPVKPLSDMLNLDRLLQTPHTSEQISVLWRAYHASRSGGTGRGYLCATIPVSTYEKMMDIAARYPSFIIPVPRDNAQTSELAVEDKRPAEFFFMEWGFHGSPLEPTSGDDLFAKPKASNNPQTSTILFTPLQEYKLRTSFATPYLVVTHYTDLARSHGLVLLRGELTPSTADAGTSGGDGRYLLSQQDAQLLAMGMQKFYLWSEGQSEREALLRRFHESPEEFKWEDLLKHAELST